MTERKRLIELIRKAKHQEYIDALTADIDTAIDMPRGEECIADYLLANGVIVPPCKEGDTVFELKTTMWMDECGECKYFQVGGFGDPHECARTKSPFKHPDCTEIEEVVSTQKDIYLWLAYGDFGKTVFRSRELAEKALAERSGK